MIALYILSTESGSMCIVFNPLSYKENMIDLFFFFKINFKYKLPFLKEIKFKIEIIG